MTWQPVPMRVLLLLAVVCAAGCTDTESLLEEGRIADAALRACDRPEDHAIVERWLVEHAPVRFSVVPQSTLAEALGGPVRIEDRDNAPLAFDVEGQVPQARRTTLHVSSSAPLARLVYQLPPLAMVDRVPVARVVDRSSLKPTPRSRGRGDGGILGALIDMSLDVGAAIGGAVAAPFVAMGAAVGGFFNALFGSGGSSASERVPVVTIAAVDGEPIDALLDDEELRVAADRTRDAFEQLRTSVDVEQQRRLALLGDANLLSPGDCAKGRCRVLLAAPPETVDVDVLFAREDFFGTRRCLYTYAAQAQTVGTRADAQVAADVDVEANVKAAQAFAQVTTSLAPRQPPWAVEYNAALPRGLAPGTRLSTTNSLTDVGCTLRLKSGWQTPRAHLVLRGTFGWDRSRAAVLGVQAGAAELSFLLHDVNLQRNERARLSLQDRGRSLGGAIVTFDGTTPLVFENAAFRAVCAAAPSIPEAQVAAALQTAEVAVQELAVDPNSIASPRPDYEQRRRREQAAEAAVVHVAALIGFNDERLTPLLKKMEAAQAP